MAFSVDLVVDGRNWKTYRKNLLRLAAKEKLVRLYDGTDMRPVDVTSDEVKAWQRRNAIAKQYIAGTIPDALCMRIMHLKTAHEFFQYLSSLFEMKKDNVT
ncbi:hypothetical protein BU15DRAFT_57062, partial [Melanogaster broomeanus]